MRESSNKQSSLLRFDCKMKRFIFLFYLLSPVILALLSAHAQGETFNVTVEEGATVTRMCDYREVYWNVTIYGKVQTVARCDFGQCYLTSLAYSGIYSVGLYNKSSQEFPVRKSYLTIYGISRLLTKIQCNLANNIITRTWLMAVIVRPQLIGCLVPTIDDTDRENNYVITVTCSFEVYPAGNCIIAVQGSLDLYKAETSYSHTLSYITNVYKTTCVHQLYVYEYEWDKETSFQVIAYPGVSSGLEYNISSPWILLLDEVGTKVLTFTLNNSSNDIMVYSDQVVVVHCAGQGDPGSTLELFERTTYKVLYSVNLPRVLTYVIQGVSCGSSYGLGCRVDSVDASDERYLNVNSIACSNSSDTYMMAVAISLAMAFIVVAIIVICCIRMRLRQRRSRCPVPPRCLSLTDGELSDFHPSAPPAYHEIFLIDLPPDTQRPPDYWSLPPPYSVSELPKTEVDQETPSETSGTQSETPGTIQTQV